MKVYGLVGHPLTHSFSKEYFSEKFETLNITDSCYKLFDLKSIKDIDELKTGESGLLGFNVTIPHKEAIIPFLDALDESAEKVGAVNVVKRTSNNEWVGYNSDYYGFLKSLSNFLTNNDVKALVLGTGGASKAVIAVLNQLGIGYQLVSRNIHHTSVTYDEAMGNRLLFSEYKLIINTTPLGMFPNIDAAPEINYELLTAQHYLYDLVYNPEETMFLQKGKEHGAKIKNGLEMLRLQAEKSWEIWNTSD